MSKGVRFVKGADASTMGMSVKASAPKGIRTPVAGLKGQCPSPLDDGGG